MKTDGEVVIQPEEFLQRPRSGHLPPRLFYSQLTFMCYVQSASARLLDRDFGPGFVVHTEGIDAALAFTEVTGEEESQI